MAAFEDSFVDTGDTALSAHAPDVGVGYTLVTGATDTYQIAATGSGLQSINTAANDAYHIDDLGSADHVTVFRVADTPNSSNHRSLFACVRLTDHDNFIGWRWFGTGSAGSRLTRCNAGSLVDLISVDGAEATIRTGWVKIETEGNTIRLFHGGTGASPTWVEVGSVTETFNNTITRQGLAKNGSTSVLNYIQYFEADVFGGGVSNDITATGSVSWATSAALTATGALTATAALAWADTATLSAVGALDAAGTVVWTTAADLSATGALSTAGTIAWTPTADLSATGSLDATGAITWTIAADLQSPTQNDIAATGAVSLTASADLSALGSLSAAATVTLAAAADLTATGNLSGTGAIAWTGIATAHQGAAMTATGAMAFTGTATLAEVSGLIARGDILISGTALLKATGSLAASAALSWSGSAALTDVAVEVARYPRFSLDRINRIALDRNTQITLRR